MKKHLKSVATFLVALSVAAGSMSAMAANYTDVPADTSYAEAVSGLSSIGILTGYEDGTFKPDANITRAEVATVVVRALAQESAANSSKGVTSFTDVPADHWASGYINVASTGNNAFINGMGDGTFNPDANVTYAQVVKMLVAGIGYGDWGVSYGGYPTGYITAAKNLGITNGVATVNADEAATRATVAQLTYNAVNTPLLSLETYSPTNPEYVILDGTGDRDYETTLTYYHNIYTVEGRVVATNKTTSGSLEAGKIRYQVENTKNYGEDNFIAKRNDEDTWFWEEMYISDTNANEYLNVYSKAMVYVDDTEEATILSIVASGKNQIAELDTKGWDDEYYADNDEAYDELTKADKGQIWFYSDKSKKGKSSKYYVAEDFIMYVNGVEVEANKDNINKYIFDNDVGKITLVDTPSEGSVSTDGKYDAMFITYYGTAVVDSVASDKIYFDTYDAGVDRSSIEFEWDDDDYDYSFTLDGQQIKFEDIKEGDVLSVAYDVEAGMKDSNFYDIIVSRNVAEGKITETDTEDGEVTIDGTSYGLIHNMADSEKRTNNSGEVEWKVGFDLGTSYTVYLDAFGRVVDKDKLASTVKYAIVHRAWYDDNSEERKVTIIDTKGVQKTLIVDEDNLKNDDDKDLSDADAWTALQGLSYDADDGAKYPQNGNYDGHEVENSYGVEDRVITYETNSKGELKSFKSLKNTPKIGDYKAKTNKIDSLSIGDNTVIIAKGDDSKTDYSLVSPSSLVDGQRYVAYGYDKDNGTYPFIVIVDGIGSYNTDTRLAVVSKVSEGTNDAGDECHKLTLFTSDSKEAKVICTDEKDDTYADLKKGDVIVYKTNADGAITEVKPFFVFGDITDYNSYMSDYLDDDGNTDGYKEKNLKTWSKNIIDRDMLPTQWLNDDDDDDVKLVCGPVIDKSSSSISIMTAENVSGGRVEIDAVEELDYASDINIIVYDFNNSKDERLYIGTAGSVIKPSIPGDYKRGSDDEFVDIKAWDNDTSITHPIALAKLVEDDVTDLFVIIPKD